MPGTFTAEVSEYVAGVKEAYTAVFRESCKRLIEDMLIPRGAGGNLPLDTGFLRASFLASKDAIPAMQRGAVPAEGATYTQDGQVNLVISTLELGETLFGGFVAAYARRMNYGFVGTDAAGRTYNQAGFLFLELAAQRWVTIVKEVEAEIIQRAGLN